MPPAVALLVLGSAVAVATMGALWAWFRRVRNMAMAEIGWTAVVAALAVLDATLANGMPGRRLAIASMMGAWGARLSIHLLYDRVFGRSDENRPADVERLRSRTDRWFFWYFQAHAVAAVVFSLPALVSVLNTADDFSPIEYVAAALWIVAFAGEATADRQLLHFKMDPENASRTCQAGLWKYLQHPNYVFEWLMWVACALFAAASPWGWLTLACPAVMLYLLVHARWTPVDEPQAVRALFFRWPRSGMA